MVGVVRVVGKYSRSGRRCSSAVAVAEEAPLGTLILKRSHIPKEVINSIIKRHIDIEIWHIGHMAFHFLHAVFM